MKEKLGKHSVFRNPSGGNLEFLNISKCVFITSYPFSPDDASGEHLEKINPFWRVAVLNNQLALLKCMYQEKDKESWVCLSVCYCKLQLTWKAKNIHQQ